MNKKEFKDGLAILYRFLKEEKIYTKILSFLFQDGTRPIDNLFREFNSKRYDDVGHWEVLFGRINLMADTFDKFDNDKYVELIEREHISRKWSDYYVKARKKQTKKKE